MITPSPSRRIVFVVANPATSALTNWPIGFWLSEVAHPYWEFVKQGYAITIASPDGGAVLADRISDPEHMPESTDFVSYGFKHHPTTAALLQNTTPLSEISVANYDGIFVIGGLSPIYTFIDLSRLHDLFAAFYEQGKIAAAICHGTCILLRARRSDGTLLATGKRWTGFSDQEERILEGRLGRQVQPFFIQSEAEKLGGTHYECGAPFQPHAVVDGTLITGQQGSSGAVTARRIIEVLEGTFLP